MSREPFQYVVVRWVPSIEREEFVNVGVILFCRTLRFLSARIELVADRLARLDPSGPAPEVVALLQAIPRIASGQPDAGPIAHLAPSERFGWLAAPSSTVVQTSLIHTGLCEDPQRTLDHLVQRLVLPAEIG